MGFTALDPLGNSTEALPTLVRNSVRHVLVRASTSSTATAVGDIPSTTEYSSG
jgi:hypothetical protein